MLAKKLAAALVAMALVLTGFAWLYQAQGANVAGPNGLCDAKSLYTMADDAERTGDQVNAGILRQAAEKCQTARLGGSPSASPSATSASPSASESASDDPAEDATIVEEFLANRPVDTKTSTNAFGPMRAVLPSLDGKKMEKLTAKQAKAELIYAVEKIDRMQTADKAIDLGIIAKNGDKNQVNDLTKQFVEDRAYWREVAKKTADKIRSLKATTKWFDETTVVGMSYAVPGKIPQVGAKDIPLGIDSKWLVLTDADGKVVAKYRLKCYFQHGGDFIEVNTPPGTTITPEGEVEVTTPPRETPPSNETPTPTPTPTPECPGKVCETPVSPPTNRPAPTSTPTRSPETTPPATPSRPATTATPTVQAPGADPTPEPSAPVPSVSQSPAPNGGDPGDPDG